MRRLVLAATMCAAILLSTAAAAVAAPSQAALGVRATAQRMPVRCHPAQAPADFMTLARRLLPSGPATISLNVYDFLGNYEAGVTVQCLVGANGDEKTTDSEGHVEFAGIPVANENGEVMVTLDDGFYDLWKLSWNAAGWTGTLQPGRLPVTLKQSSDGWNTWEYARVWLWADNGGGVERHLAATDIQKTGATTSGYAHTITTGTEQLTKGAVYFWNDEGLELNVAGTAVSPGVQATPSASPVADESKAQRIWPGGWGSGKPGATVNLVLNKYPAGWATEIWGLADYPATAQWSKRVKAFTTSGKTSQTKKVTIPTTVKPGYTYYISADHVDENGVLSLITRFQVCTLKPSKASIRRGTAINLSGVVPIKGHYGSKKGTRKYVTIYKTTSSKIAKLQPQALGGKAKAAGWTKLARVRTDGLGKYLKKSVKPAKTTWYCVWYPGDSWYWGAWTSTAKVTVK